ncbi:hypothetical protein [Mesorhizobium sp. A623]
MASKQTIHPKAVPWLTAGAMLFGVGLLIGWWYQPYPELIATVFSENGPVETLEMVALTSAAALFVFRAARSNDPIGTMCIPIALVLASAIVRETPRCDSSFYDGGMCFPDQQWKNVTIGLFLTIAAIALFIRRRHFFAVFSIQRIHVFWPIWISALLLISAEISERYGVMGTEEVVEFFAYFYLACFGVWMQRNT